MSMNYRDKLNELENRSNRRETLKQDKKYLQEACANCEDWEKIFNKDCTSCEIFKTLRAVSEELQQN